MIYNCYSVYGRLLSYYVDVELTLEYDLRIHSLAVTLFFFPAHLPSLLALSVSPQAYT